MAETLLSFGVEKLWDLLVRESERFQGVDEKLTELKNDLMLLRSFLKDADAKKDAMQTVKNCVGQIKEIVLDAEDIIETFLQTEELSKTSGIKKHMRRFSWIIMDRSKLVLDMEAIRKRISKVIHDMQSFGVQQMIIKGGEYPHPLQERQREMRKTFPSNNEKNLVGLEENVKKLVGYLVKDDSSQVVAITGMGGIGKTTLARQAFNHEMVKNRFNGFAWVCISQHFTRKYVWETIFQKLSSEHDEQRDSNMTEDELQEKLFRLLETSNSLIVLDDMWKEEDWDRIKDVFPSKKGWKVLLTSRNERVALHADTTCVTIKPECLTPEESWTLFQRIAFPFTEDTSKYKVEVEIEELGKKMIKHCGGLPLAVKVLGGLLAKRHTLNEWKRVCENIGSYLAGRTSFSDGNHNSVHYILSLSFEELPISLKHCFLYLAHYPEDYPIYMEILSYYWAAEGITKPEYNNGATIRDAADLYIEELVTRNMVISERDTLTCRFENFQLHDMMRDVCLQKAKEENFLHIVPGTSTADSESRRLAIHLPGETFNVEAEMMNPKLRSLLIFNKKLRKIKWLASNLLFTDLQMMRVLDLSSAKFKGGKLPSSIGKLIHLRYLSLYQAKVTHLPSSMQNLKKLLYLNLYVVDSGYPIYIPNFMKEIRELTYLYLPWQIDDKVKMDLGNLVNLETLKNFSTNNCNVKDLHRMTRLGTLSIRYNGGCTMKTLSSTLSGLSHLENLKIDDDKVYARKNDEEEFVLDCVYLKHLELSVYMPKLPDEQHFPSHLTSIDLDGCRLKEDPMPILEKFLQLKEVNLLISFCGKRMVCSGSGFPQLHRLTLCGLMELEEWIVEEGSMPLLHFLTLNSCEKLKMIPDGLRFITSLEELQIYTTDLDMKKEWEERLSEEGEDYYKVQHIPFVTIY